MVHLPEDGSLSDAFQILRVAFKDIGIDTADLDARLIILDRCDLSHSEFIATPQRPVTTKEKQQIEDAANKRLHRVPMSQILGYKEFYGRKFAVSEYTLTPRPDSELLIDIALGHLVNDTRPHILDLGTGTGCLLLTLLSECENSRGVGVDVSPEALSVAQTNASQLDLAMRSDFLTGNWFDPVEGKFDLVISNPPYIETDTIPHLQKEVRLHEPYLALDGGVDGLAPYRCIIAQAPVYLRPGGMLVLEIGSEQKDQVLSLFSELSAEQSYSEISCAQDIEGRDRCVYATY